MAFGEYNFGSAVPACKSYYTTYLISGLTVYTLDP